MATLTHHTSIPLRSLELSVAHIPHTMYLESLMQANSPICHDLYMAIEIAIHPNVARLAGSQLPRPQHAFPMIRSSMKWCTHPLSRN